MPNPPQLFKYNVFALAHNNLGGILDKKNMVQEAKEHYMKSIAITNAINDKEFWWPYRALAKLYEGIDLMENAKQYYKVSQR